MTIGLGHSLADQAEAMPLGDWRQQLHHIIMYCLLLPEYALMEELLTANPNQVRANLEALKKSRQPVVAEWAVPNATPLGNFGGQREYVEKADQPVYALCTEHQ
ncbi:hypothetical protein N7535_004456 [Penicillium sp. DV-2018c]|nr:hypothetical protein N7535_004456 [Penicillium sp. DV-2018c]